jgi:predicted dehydrogenase
MKLVVLDPGHFHAALLQKTMYPDIDPTVHVYAEDGPELADYLKKVESYNARTDNPTSWRIELHAAPDFLDRFVADRAGDVVVIAGNNRHKAEYISRAVATGMHVLADKPMAIDGAGFDALVRAFADARGRGVLLYDIMTERFEITTMLQKAVSQIPEVFGDLLHGSPAEPAVVKESVHYFSKLVSGLPVKRPAWFFDVEQQGEGLTDITTHLVDLVQWECFPGESLDFSRDVAVLAAKRWPTGITPAQFESLTQLTRYPEFLRKDVEPEGNLLVYANGEIDYRIKGVHAKVRVLWNYEAPPGSGDTHYSLLRGSKANLVIRQGAAEGWQPTLYMEPATSKVAAEMPALLGAAMQNIRAAFPGVDVERAGSEWRVVVPQSYHVGHEAHFGQVASAFLRYVAEGALPSWEVPNMIAKYHTTTRALALAHGGQQPIP